MYNSGAGKAGLKLNGRGGLGFTGWAGWAGGAGREGLDGLLGLPGKRKGINFCHYRSAG